MTFQSYKPIDCTLTDGNLDLMIDQLNAIAVNKRVAMVTFILKNCMDIVKDKQIEHILDTWVVYDASLRQVLAFYGNKDELIGLVAFINQIGKLNRYPLWKSFLHLINDKLLSMDVVLAIVHYSEVFALEDYKVFLKKVPLARFTMKSEETLSETLLSIS